MEHIVKIKFTTKLLIYKTSLLAIIPQQSNLCVFVSLFIYIYIYIYILYIYIYICIKCVSIWLVVPFFFKQFISFLYMKVGWKVHRLTKILSKNVTKCGYFFNIVSFAFHTLLPLVLQCLDPIGPNSHQQQIWLHHINFLGPPSNICVCVCILFTHF